MEIFKGGMWGLFWGLLIAGETAFMFGGLIAVAEGDLGRGEDLGLLLLLWAGFVLVPVGVFMGLLYGVIRAARRADRDEVSSRS